VTKERSEDCVRGHEALAVRGDDQSLGARPFLVPKKGLELIRRFLIAIEECAPDVYLRRRQLEVFRRDHPVRRPDVNRHGSNFSGLRCIEWRPTQNAE
jgi:hypothetical protein